MGGQPNLSTHANGRGSRNTEWWAVGVGMAVVVVCLMALLAPQPVSAASVPDVYYGEEATAHEFPMAVHLSIGNSVCTGSLVRSEWVLTAAHCLRGIDLDGGTGATVAANTVTMQLGVHDRTDGSREEQRGALAVFPHADAVNSYTTLRDDDGNPRFDDDGNPLRSWDDFVADIALVRLDRVVRQTERVQLVELGALDDGDDEVTLLGWGLTEDEVLPAELHKAEDVPILDCPDVVLDWTDDSFFCAGETVSAGRDPSLCGGDSGGPVLHEGVQVGVNSAAACGWYSIATGVDDYLDWIEETVRAEGPSAHLTVSPGNRVVANITTGDPRRMAANVTLDSTGSWVDADDGWFTYIATNAATGERVVQRQNNEGRVQMQLGTGVWDIRLQIVRVLSGTESVAIQQVKIGGPTECNGLAVTVDLALGEVPTNGDDVIMGTPGDDTVKALFGADTICGQAGNDSLSGNQGDDVIFGGPGNDTLHGGYNNDTVHGEAGNDTIVNNRGNDVMHGGPGNDTITGGRHNDEIRGDDGDDVLNGRGGNDRVYGGFGADRLFGEGGADLLAGNQGNDEIRGGDGNDNLHGGYDDDKVFGDAGNDRLTNNRGTDHMYGGDGDDSLTGGRDRDLLWGDAGADTMRGEAGHDLLQGGDGDDRMWGGTGNDFLLGHNGNDFIAGNQNNDTLFGGPGNDELHGGYDNDDVRGDAGNDTLINNRGNDRMDGGSGNDTCRRGNGTDTLISC